MINRALTTSVAFGRCVFVGTILALFVLVVGYGEGGTDGPCTFTTDFVKSHPEAADFRKEDSTWPPGRTCVALAVDGSRIASRTYPEPVDWAVAVLAFLLPFGVWAAVRRLRRGAPAGRVA